jgi:hypothetical protein
VRDNERYVMFKLLGNINFSNSGRIQEDIENILFHNEKGGEQKVVVLHVHHGT